MEELWNFDNIQINLDADKGDLVIRIAIKHAETTRHKIKGAVERALRALPGYTGNDRYLVYLAIQNSPLGELSRSELGQKMISRKIFAAELNDYLRSLYECDKIGVRYEKPRRGRIQEIYFIKGDL